MRKIFFILFGFIFITGCVAQNTNQTNTSGEIVNNTTKSNLVSYNGNLRVSGVDILNQYDEKIQLKGVSSHGLQWYSNYINKENIKILRDDWKSNVFRIAMYTDEGGYLSNKDLYNTLVDKVDMIVKNDMYVIIDWHILKDNNPNTHVEEAKDFFERISLKYKDVPNIIYEICNEPNGDVSWNKDIKPYADEVIKVIRKNSKKAIIIVGTSTWSQDILDPMENRINDENVMYALHFYAGTHTDWLRERIVKARENNIPIFVSEWGVSSADGNGGVYLEEATKWVNFMNENSISWINWSLSDKNESSAILKNGTNENGFSDSDLTESGTFIKKAIKGE